MIIHSFMISHVVPAHIAVNLKVTCPSLLLASSNRKVFPVTVMNMFVSTIYFGL